MKTRSCTRCRRRPARALGQAYCKVCHAKASKAHRERRRLELEQLRAMAAKLGEPALR